MCLFVLALVSVVMWSNSKEIALGSAVDGQTHSATTSPLGVGATTVILKPGGGVLGQVVVTGMNSGNIQLYDATTSDVNLRAATMSTTSLLIASIPAGAASSTYMYDITLKYGLLYVGVGSVPTTSIMFR